MADSQERFQALIENRSDALSLINAEGRVLYANPSTARVLGYPPEGLLGQNGFDLLHPQDREHCVQTLQRVLAEPRRADQMQVRVRQKDGQWRWVESTASNLLDEPHIGAILLNHREISTRRAEEEERQRLSQELIRSNAELQAYAHTVAHDLREPLRTISTFTEILMRRAQLAEEDQRVADFIVDGVRRMSSLLDSLLSSATCGHSNVIEPVNLEHTARQAMENMKQLSPRAEPR